MILRFSYTVLDPEKAKALNDKKHSPKLISPEKGVELVIPEMDNVGILRQTTIAPGKVYKAGTAKTLSQDGKNSAQVPLLFALGQITNRKSRVSIEWGIAVRDP